MPLAPCPDCGNDCSTMAAACPKCGRPFKSPSEVETDDAATATSTVRGRSKTNWPLIVIVALNFIALIWVLSHVRGSQIAGEAEARDALTSLRKIEAATQAGVSYMNYQPLVIEAQAKVNEASAKLPDGELKTELQGAISAYADAGRAWSYYSQGKVLRNDTEPGRTLTAKYGLTVFGYSHESKEVLSTIWLVASDYVNQAAKKLGN
jgi:hypothetical protein